MRKILIALTGLVAFLALSGCGYTPTGNQQEAKQQQANDQQQMQTQPLPSFPYSQWRQNLIEIETAEAKGVQTTSFIFGPANTPDPVQVCPSVGVPIPVTASLSNPHQIDAKWFDQTGGGHLADGVVDQKDPSGIYMPSGSAGTFVICIGSDGSAAPVYAEGNVHTVFGPAVWDYNNHQVRVTGAASFHFSKGRGQ